MLKRKIERQLEQFVAIKPKSAILLTGARQVGKTFTRISLRRSFMRMVSLSITSVLARLARWISSSSMMAAWSR